MWKLVTISVILSEFIHQTHGLATNGRLCTGTGTVGAVSIADLTTVSDSVDTNIAFGYMAETPEYTFDCCGLVTSWSLVAPYLGTVSLHVWRRTATGSYLMVGENYCTVSVLNTVVTCNIAEIDQITVQTGDFMGWRAAGEESVKFTNAAHFTETEFPTLIRRINTLDLHPGDTYDWSQIEAYNDRKYAITASYRPPLAPAFTLTSPVAVPDTANSGTSVATVTYSDPDLTENGTLTVFQTHTSPYYTIDIATGVVKTSQAYRLQADTMRYAAYDTCYVSNSATQSFTVTDTSITIIGLPATVTIAETGITQDLLHTITVSEPTDQFYCISSWQVAWPFLLLPISTTAYGIYVSDYPGFDFDTKSRYNLQVDCLENTIAGTTATVSGTLTVRLTRNRAPSITNLDAAAIVNALASRRGDTAFQVTASDPENDDLTYTMTCDPAATCPFQIQASGHIQLSQGLLFHSVYSYDLAITISDGKSTDGPNNLHIDITNINDMPEFTNIPTVALAVQENTPLDTSIYTFTYEDLDVADTKVMTMTISDHKLTRLLNLDPATGLLSTKFKVIDYEEFAAWSFVITLTITDGTKTAVTATVNLNIINQNEAPYFNHDDFDVDIDEGASGTALNLNPTMVVTDPDSVDATLYSLDCGADTHRFNIDTTSGAITFEGDYDLDVSGTPSDVTCTITVRDTAGLSDTATLYVHVNNVNEFAPKFTASAYDLYADMSALVGTSVYQLSAVDQDAALGNDAKVTYSLDQTGLAINYFHIDNDGNIYILNDLPGGTNLIFTAKVENKFASPVLFSTATLTVDIPGTTTVTTTTTDRVFGFTESYRNVIWLTVAIGGAVAFVLALTVALFQVIRHETPRCIRDGFWCCKRELLPHEIGFGDQEYDFETFGRPHNYDDARPLPTDVWYQHAVDKNKPNRIMSPIGPERVHLEKKKKGWFGRSQSPQPDDSVSQMGDYARAGVSRPHGSNVRHSNNPRQDPGLYEMFRIPIPEQQRQRDITSQNPRRGWVD